MATSTDAEASRRLADVLARVKAEGEVRIISNDGTAFAVVRVARSPLDVGGIQPRSLITVDDVLQAIRDGLERREF